MTIPEEKWKAYRETAKRREEEERRNLKLRFQKAWRVARLASTFLNKNFGARKVFVFGSLLNEELFHLKSDINLAVLGLDEKHYYRAQGQLLALDPEFGIDLILMEDVSESLKENKSLPSGPVWHQDLILQLSADSEKLRPRVICAETRYCLDEYRGFRHIVRNVYTFHFKASRLEELANGVRPCYQLVEKDLNSFNDFLLKTAG